MNTYELVPAPFGYQAVHLDYKVCTLIEKHDGSREIVYGEEKIEETPDIKKWWHEKITVRKIDEIKGVQDGMMERIQYILATI